MFKVMEFCLKGSCENKMYTLFDVFWRLISKAKAAYTVYLCCRKMCELLYQYLNRESVLFSHSIVSLTKWEVLFIFFKKENNSLFVFRLKKYSKWALHWGFVCWACSDCESLLSLSFILEYIACNSVWILSVRLKCTSERFAAASRFLFQPWKPLTSLFIDKCSYFTCVSLLGWSSWCWEWWRRYHYLQFVIF